MLSGTPQPARRAAAQLSRTKEKDRKFAKGRFNDINSQQIVGSSSVVADANKLLSASLAKSSWNKYRSAERSYTEFATASKTSPCWPIPAPAVRGYVTWMTRSKHRSPETVKEYLAGLRFLHIARGLPTDGLDDKLVKKLLEGAKNLAKIEGATKRVRRVMSVPLMMLLKSELSNWSGPTLERSAFWCAATAAFQSSCRLGEILSHKKFEFDPQNTLLASDLKFREGIISLRIRNPKIKEDGDTFLEIYPTDDDICPVTALEEHVRALKEIELFHKEAPVVTTGPSRYLSLDKFNFILRALLKRHIDLKKHPISAHSFRASVASITQRSNNTEVDVNSWGRWKSRCVSKYRRLSWQQRKSQFSMLKDDLSSKRV